MTIAVGPVIVTLPPSSSGVTPWASAEMEASVMKMNPPMSSAMLPPAASEAGGGVRVEGGGDLDVRDSVISDNVGDGLAGTWVNVSFPASLSIVGTVVSGVIVISLARAM